MTGPIGNSGPEEGKRVSRNAKRKITATRNKRAAGDATGEHADETPSASDQAHLDDVIAQGALEEAKTATELSALEAENESLRSELLSGRREAFDAALRRPELDLNLEANRTLRRLAFMAAGIASLLFLALLFVTLCQIFWGGALVPLLPFMKGEGWHVLVLVTLALVVMTTVPLSLVMALVRMVSENSRNESDAALRDVTFPTSELIKIVAEAAKTAARQ